MPGIKVFQENAAAYDAWFDAHPKAYASELEAVRELLPRDGFGVEIGVGTGRFAAALGIDLGVEPAAAMREMARRRGVHVVDARAESLPFASERFDYALMVTTVCFLDDVEAAFTEAYRILKSGGVFVAAVIDSTSPLGRRYERGKAESTFYADARFHSVEAVAGWMRDAGFEDLMFRQTLFGDPEETATPDEVRPGYGDGAFVVIRGRKDVGGAEQPEAAPLLEDKAYDEASVFTPENLLREARRQNRTDDGPIPDVCILDPDGDIVRFLKADGRARLNPSWACYHTELYDFEFEGRTFGIVGFAVGASFAVLVAEELFASGCRLVVSVTSSGRIVERGDPPYFVLIEKALRDEGTSYHYLPAAEFAALDLDLDRALEGALADLPIDVHRGASWTTDAPFRETKTAIEAARRRGILCVEMEAAALYAMAEARGFPVICFAHVTNQMARIEGDFEKGEAGGSVEALQLVAAAVEGLQRGQAGGKV